MNFNDYSDRAAMMPAIALHLAYGLELKLQQGGRASLAVAGGTTPGPIFDVLSGLDLDWSRVDAMLTDERWVEETSARSNTALLRQRLLVGRAKAAHLVPLFGGTDTPEQSLADLTRGLGKSLPLTAVLLGMGADMHTASIFPGADQLAQALADDAPALLAMRAPGAPEPRMTLSANVLNQAGLKILVITGAEKREAFEKAKELSEVDAPVRAVMQDLHVYWAP